MNLPVSAQPKRQFADLSLPNISCLADRVHAARVIPAIGVAHRVTPVAFQDDHTPSPRGQRVTSVSLLPFFSWQGDVKHKRKMAGNRNSPKRVVVVLLQETTKGAGQCLSNQVRSDRASSASRFVAGWQRAATPSVSRRWQAVPSAQVQQPLPVAASSKGPQSARRAIWPIASLIPASAAATDPSLTSLTGDARSRFRSTPFHSPAQPLLSRGFRVSPKTQKDSICSRKS